MWNEPMWLIHVHLNGSYININISIFNDVNFICILYIYLRKYFLLADNCMEITIFTLSGCKIVEYYTL